MRGKNVIASDIQMSSQSSRPVWCRLHSDKAWLDGQRHLSLFWRLVPAQHMQCTWSYSLSTFEGAQVTCCDSQSMTRQALSSLPRAHAMSIRSHTDRRSATACSQLRTCRTSIAPQQGARQGLVQQHRLRKQPREQRPAEQQEQERDLEAARQQPGHPVARAEVLRLGRRPVHAQVLPGPHLHLSITMLQLVAVAAMLQQQKEVLQSY